MTCSMSRKGNYWDDAPVKRVFGAVKIKSLHHRILATPDEARREIFKYIDVFDNRQRKRLALDFSNPVEFEMADMA